MLNSSKRVFLFIFFIIVITLLPLVLIYFQAKSLKTAGVSLASAYSNQNFGQMQESISQIKSEIQKIDLSLNLLIWLKIIPIIGGYYGDIKNLTSAANKDLAETEKIFAELKPYEKELGFIGQPLAGGDRISQAVKVLNKTLPLIDKSEANFVKAKENVKNINPQKYPENLAGFKIRQSVQLSRDVIMAAGLAVSEQRDALNLLPAFLGFPQEKNYLLLFQNDKEIRATGGFLTAYAFLKIDKGVINTTVSDDIYRLDERLLATCESKICPLTPPAPIFKYLPEVDGKVRKAWSMRDSNLSPDVPTSAKEFERIYQLLGQGLPFDGIIFIDTRVVEEIIKVIGEIEVFGTKYSAEIDKRCSCPNVIYELESYAEVVAKEEQDRKAILGILMQQVLARALSSDSEKLPFLIDAVVRSAKEKHLVFFMHDSDFQNALSKLDWTGEIKEFEGDYLHINDSNFAGGKSNLYVEQTVTQEIKTEKTRVKKKITVEYKNPLAFSSWLNGINRDYVRFYVPKGSKLISSKGSEDTVTTIEDLGKTVFEAFITVRPQNSRKLEIEYEIPYQVKNEYKQSFTKYNLLIQKQPGAKDFRYIIQLNGRRLKDFQLTTDKELNERI